MKYLISKRKANGESHSQFNGTKKEVRRWKKTTIYTKSRKIPETNSAVTPTRNRLESVEMSHRRLPGRRFNLSLPRHNSLGSPDLPTCGRLVNTPWGGYPNGGETEANA